MGKKILVVDDDPDTQATLRLRLEKNGYEVDAAGTREECMAKVREERPDLILLDVLLPGAGGFGICRDLKEDESTRQIPVIILTALTGEEIVKKGEESGAAHLISKPFDPADLLQRMKDLLQKGGSIIP